MTPTLKDYRRTVRRTTHLSEDERNRLLASERRRVTLDVLADRTAPVSLRDLAAAVAAHEADVRTDDEAVERVAITLHHVHLPKLAALGVVDYDADEARVESGPRDAPFD